MSLRVTTHLKLLFMHQQLQSALHLEVSLTRASTDLKIHIHSLKSALHRVRQQYKEQGHKYALFV